MKIAILTVLMITVLAAGSLYYLYEKSAVLLIPTPVSVATTSITKLVSSAGFYCQSNKTIMAEFFETSTTVSTATLGTVKLVFSDGRKLDLTQTLSATGARYATTDETFVFWNKGNGALVTENGEENDYKNCVRAATALPNSDLTRVYVASDGAFSIRLPGFGTATTTQYTADTTHTHAVAGSKKSRGVSFTIPSAIATGSNLSADSYISVEELDTARCTASQFTTIAATSSLVSLNLVEYSLATTSEAGAGNLYEEQIYALPDTVPCTAVRYVIHSTAYENYPEGSVTAFDQTKLLATFDQIRQSLVINQ